MCIAKVADGREEENIVENTSCPTRAFPQEENLKINNKKIYKKGLAKNPPTEVISSHTVKSHAVGCHPPQVAISRPLNPSPGAR
jgi:hypothetical protein